MRPYPLELVLALRAREADAAGAELAAALAALDGRREELWRLDTAAAALARRAFAEACRIGHDFAPGTIAARGRWAARLRAELEALHPVREAAARAAAAAAIQVERRREALSEARAALRALELHRDLWRAAQARARDAAEQDAADDLVSARRRAGR